MHLISHTSSPAQWAPGVGVPRVGVIYFIIDTGNNAIMIDIIKNIQVSFQNKEQNLKSTMGKYGGVIRF